MRECHGDSCRFIEDPAVRVRERWGGGEGGGRVFNAQSTEQVITGLEARRGRRRGIGGRAHEHGKLDVEAWLLTFAGGVPARMPEALAVGTGTAGLYTQPTIRWPCSTLVWTSPPTSEPRDRFWRH